MPVSAYAAIQMQTSQSRVIPVYESDGITVIDTFVIDATILSIHNFKPELTF